MKTITAVFVAFTCTLAMPIAPTRAEAAASMPLEDGYVYLDAMFNTDFDPDPVVIVGDGSVNPYTTADVGVNLYLWEDKKEKLPAGIVSQTYTVTWGDATDGVAVDAVPSATGFTKTRTAANQIVLTKTGGNTKVSLVIKITGGFKTPGQHKGVKVTCVVAFSPIDVLTQEITGDIYACDLVIMQPNVTGENATEAGIPIPFSIQPLDDGELPMDCTSSIDNANIRMSEPWVVDEVGSSGLPLGWYVSAYPGDPNGFNSAANRACVGNWNGTIAAYNGNSKRTKRFTLTVTNAPPRLVQDNMPAVIGGGAYAFFVQVGDPERSVTVVMSIDNAAVQARANALLQLPGLLSWVDWLGAILTSTPTLTTGDSDPAADGGVVQHGQIDLNATGLFYTFVKAVRDVSNQAFFLPITITLQPNDGGPGAILHRSISIE
jgi:hypothetical protein